MNARDLLALANLKKRDRYIGDRAKLEAPKKQDWRWVGFDSTIGMGVVKSGNVTKRGKVITNGYLVPGQPVEFNEDGQFATIEGRQYIKPEGKRKQTFVPKAVESAKIVLALGRGSGVASETFIGAIGPDLIQLPQNYQSAKVSKTDDGWIYSAVWGATNISESLNANQPQSAVNVFAGDESSGSLSWSIAPLQTYKTPAVFGSQYRTATSLSHLGYGYLGTPRYIQGAVPPISAVFTPFADGTNSDLDNQNVSKPASYQYGYLFGGALTSSLVAGVFSASSGPSPTATSSLTGALSLPDGTSLTVSQNTSSSSAANNGTSRERLILLVSQDPQNLITYEIDEDNIQGVNNIVLRFNWRKNGASVTFASALNGVLSGFSEVITLDFAYLSLIENNIYFVNMAASSPETGSYSVDIYNLATLTKSTEVIAANPIPDFTTGNYYAISASYHP